ncbi:MAG: RHS repeat-associated core domain-containing protein [Bacteroidales bacterium]|jgi:RHS repeat-associated protein|nr:RHS repeat-associated core domain-containing protein [Bacteroidales bacterium]
MGEVVKNIRTFALPNEQNTYTFAMSFKYDSWNRILSTFYPDGEHVRYWKGYTKYYYAGSERVIGVLFDAHEFRLDKLYFYKNAESGTMDRYFYHPDHIGSSSWITDNTGRPIQHLHYLPFGEDWVDQRTTSWNAPYTFSGKEKDSETGYGYFGARYYDSGLSIWLSVDPMSDKYPSMSPYNYCANNPVMLVDPDGRDCEILVDEKAKTITIMASYYTSRDHKSELESFVKSWNDQSGKYEILDENGTAYTVNFKLNVKANYTENGARNAYINASQSDKDANFFDVTNTHAAYKSDTRGLTINGDAIYVKPDAPNRTRIHEIGHTLGSLHTNIGVMEQGGTSSDILKSNIYDIFRNAGQNVNCVESGVIYTNETDSNCKSTWHGRNFSSSSTLREKR